MNQVIFQINELPFSRTSPIHLSQAELFLLYGILFLLIVFLVEKKLRYLKISLFAIILLSAVNLYKKTQLHYQEALTVYSIKKHTCIGITYNQQMYLLVDESLAKDSKKIDFHISNHLLALGYSNYNLVNIDSETLNLPFSHKRHKDNLFLVINGKRIAIINKRVNFISQAKFDLSIFRNGSLKEFPKIDSKKTILDASNRIFHNANYNETQSVQNRVHTTKNNGAYTFSLN